MTPAYRFAAAMIGGGILATGAGAAMAQDALPPQFLGLWQVVQPGRTPSCSPDDADIRMQVFRDRTEFHEGKCEFVSVRANADRTKAEIELSCRGEGEEWRDRQAWTWRKTQTGAMLDLDWLDRDLSTVHYAPCRAEASAAAAPALPAGACYDDGNSSLTVRMVSPSQAEIVVSSVQSRGAHMCNLSGMAEVMAGGWRYTERIDGVGDCRLDIMIGEDRSVRMVDRDWTCKGYYCGARAVFDHIEFAPSSERGC